MAFQLRCRPNFSIYFIHTVILYVQNSSTEPAALVLSFAAALCLSVASCGKKSIYPPHLPLSRPEIYRADAGKVAVLRRTACAAERDATELASNPGPHVQE